MSKFPLMSVVAVVHQPSALMASDLCTLGDGSHWPCSQRDLQDTGSGWICPRSQFLPLAGPQQWI